MSNTSFKKGRYQHLIENVLIIVLALVLPMSLVALLVTARGAEELLQTIQSYNSTGLLTFVGIIGTLGFKKAYYRSTVAILFASGLLLAISQLLTELFPYSPSVSGSLPLHAAIPITAFTFAIVGLFSCAFIALRHHVSEGSGPTPAKLKEQASPQITPDPTSKTSGEPAARVPSDLARDLRLSRSHARRSRVGR